VAEWHRFGTTSVDLDKVAAVYVARPSYDKPFNVYVNATQASGSPTSGDFTVIATGFVTEDDAWAFVASIFSNTP
jgi:hypothetical protein